MRTGGGLFLPFKLSLVLTRTEIAAGTRFLFLHFDIITFDVITFDVMKVSDVNLKFDFIKNCYETINANP